MLYLSDLMNQEQMKEIIKKNKTNWIQVHFTDIMGRLRVLHIPTERFFEDNILNKGFRFDGSSVGFRKVEKSDMIALPDINTFHVLPHEEHEAIIRADLYDSVLNRYRAGPRHILKSAVKAAQSQGYDTVSVSPEMEFYAFDEREEDRYEIDENKGYFVPPPLDTMKDYRKMLSNMLKESGYTVKYHHHEKGKYQHEVEIKALHALEAADFCSYFKYLAQDIADFFDIMITFMPKPLSGEPGNGMHAHITLYKKGKNMFLDEHDQYNLSQTALYFIGGILDHARGMAALANPTLNSYKRLIPHFEAPMYIAWAMYNRSTLIRIPAKKNVDVEIRNADPVANPYLLFAAMIHAGLDGIKKKITYEPVTNNIYQMTEAEIKDRGIQRLPTNLMEALEEFEQDAVLMKGIGKDAAELFIENKKNEWHQYMSEITELDYRFYFHC